jgi:hypothetical protein
MQVRFLRAASGGSIAERTVHGGYAPDPFIEHWFK